MTTTTDLVALLGRPAASRGVVRRKRRKRQDQTRRRRGAPAIGTGIARSYLADLLRVVKKLNDLIAKRLIAELPGLATLRDATLDAAPTNRTGKSLAMTKALLTWRADVADDVRRITDRIQIEFEEEISDTALRELARRRGEELSSFERRQLQRQFKRALGVDFIADDPRLQQRLASFSRENADLIKNMARSHVERVRSTVTNALQGGQRHEDIARTLRFQQGIPRRRARLIARDQISKLNGQLTRARQTANGITKFRWVTVGDERVRDEHDEIDDQVFTWASGHPSEGFPGQPINCRCTAEPVFDD